ncbi:HNH endonuclease [Oryzomonas rubra]|uniref:HNH endonuclease n=2 Tax=Oryzomonas rubra TaxID=2509454 RepID=A0A5A9XQM7_9BACT|nr:HNH endonuclease [Oryzomonas rubra]
MPSTAIAKAISARSSSITAAFVSSILPIIPPTDDEILQALLILEMEPGNVRCAYCGDKSSEWDHLRPIVTDQMPTGFISEIRNLVPSCGKCNQSKGKSHWRQWMLGPAKRSPGTRKIVDLHERITRLEAYEKWGNVTPIDFASIVPPDLWQEHWLNMHRLHDDMKLAQEVALRVRKVIEDKTLQS